MWTLAMPVFALNWDRASERGELRVHHLGQAPCPTRAAALEGALGQIDGTSHASTLGANRSRYRGHSNPAREEVVMAQDANPTNERIVELLDDVMRELHELQSGQRQLTTDVGKLALLKRG